MTPGGFITLLILGLTAVGIVATAWDKLQVRRAIRAIEHGADPGDIDPDTLAEIPERQRQRLIALVRSREGAKSRQAPAYQAAAPQQPAVLAPRFSEFDEPAPQAKPQLDLVTLAKALHLFVNGETGGGKTVLLHALTGMWVRQGARVLVCDSAARSGFWPGCEVYGVQQRFDDMARAIQEFEAEFNRRNEESLDYDLDEQDWYLVVDEFKHANKATNGHIQVIAERLTEQGRKYGLHMVIATQSDQGGTNDIKNITAFRKNFTYVVELFQGRRSVIKRSNGTWVGEYETPRLPDPNKVYFKPGDSRYDRFRRSRADVMPAETPKVAPPEDVVGAVLTLVDEIAAELPHVAELAEGSDPKLIDGARDEGLVYIRPELFTSGLEGLGLADRKAEIEQRLHQAGLLVVDDSQLLLNKYYKQKRLGRGIKSAPWYAVRRDQRAVTA